MNSFRVRPWSSLFAAALAGSLAFAAAPRAGAALTAHYTLDDLSAGLLNLGTDGSTSNLSAPDAASTPTSVAGIIGSGALRFDGNDILRNITAGNAADDLAGYPFTMSVWVSGAVVDSSRDTIFTISDRAVGDRYFGTGVDPLVGGGRSEPELVRRNGAFTELSATGGVTATGATWVNIVAVFGTGGAQLYVNGKLSNSASGAPAFVTSLNTLSIGGFLRNGSTTTPTDPLTGNADDVGLFDSGLVASDAALIHGLGRLGAIGLDALDEAQALLTLSTGSTAFVGTYEWEKVAGLPGTTGDTGGSIASSDAYIVTASDGTGLRLVPEPATATLAAFGALSLLARRKRARR